MKSNLKRKKQGQSENELEELRSAFEKFSDASARLQSEYERLQNESSALRQQLAQKEVEVKKAERLATLGETAAALAHEIRNPLGAITLYTSLLEDDLEERPEQLKLVKAIENSAVSLNHVVSNILQFARQKEPAFVPLQLEAITREIIEEVQASFPGIEFRIQSEGPIYLLGDQHGMRQLFRNVFRNACQAQRDKGAIEVTLRDAGGEAEARVRDWGPGIPEGEAERLFEPFTTTKNEGTGLGLAIVRRIVDQHSGYVRARNWENGAEFLFGFPKKVPITQVK